MKKTGLACDLERRIGFWAFIDSSFENESKNFLYFS